MIPTPQIQDDYRPDWELPLYFAIFFNYWIWQLSNLKIINAFINSCEYRFSNNEDFKDLNCNLIPNKPNRKFPSPHFAFNWTHLVGHDVRGAFPPDIAWICLNLLICKRSNLDPFSRTKYFGIGNAYQLKLIVFELSVSKET